MKLSVPNPFPESFSNLDYRGSGRKLPRLIWWSLLAWVPLLSLLLSGTVVAQQPVTNTDQIDIGPYRIAVTGGASPLALGSARYEVTLLAMADGQPVPNAQVLLRTRHLEKGIEGWAAALNTPGSPALYRAELTLDRPGPWSVTLEVSSPLGRVESGLTPLVIPRARSYSSGSLVFAGVTVVLLLGLAYVLWSIRRAQRKGASRAG